MSTVMNVAETQPRRRFRIVDVFSRACSNRRNPRHPSTTKRCSTTPATPPAPPLPSRPEPDECPICLEPLTKETGAVSLGCSHRMCPACFAQLARNDHRCPMCRTGLPGVPALASGPPAAARPELTEDAIYDLALASIDTARATHGDDLGGRVVLDSHRDRSFRRACLETLLASHALRTMRIARAFLEYPAQG